MIPIVAAGWAGCSEKKEEMFRVADEGREK
jgi:hypothetical protein